MNKGDSPTILLVVQPRNPTDAINLTVLAEGKPELNQIAVTDWGGGLERQAFLGIIQNVTGKFLLQLNKGELQGGFARMLAAFRDHEHPVLCSCPGIPQERRRYRRLPRQRASGRGGDKTTDTSEFLLSRIQQMSRECKSFYVPVPAGLGRRRLQRFFGVARLFPISDDSLDEVGIELTGRKVGVGHNFAM